MQSPPFNPFRSIRHIPGQAVTYIQNPKVACTSFKLALWRAHDPAGMPANPHRHPDSPFGITRSELTPAAADRLLASTFFSVVRNPYARILSAYLDKIARGSPGKQGWWQKRAPAFGLPPDSNVPTLANLLRAMRNSDPVEVDHHFRPQYLNLLHDFVPLDFLGHMEQFENVTAWLADRGFVLGNGAPRNKTDAAGKLAMIDAEAAALIRDYYGEDFRLYGYSEDIGIIEPVRAAKISADRGPLRRYLARFTRKTSKLVDSG